MASEAKERILDVAERLFANRGFSASLRDITAEAGVNLASVTYHFGSKEALCAVVRRRLERRLRPINARRLELLHAIESVAGDDPPSLEEVVRAFLSPPFHKQLEWGERGLTFLKFVGLIHAETDLTDHHVIQRFTAALRRALPHLNAADVNCRMLFLVGSMAFAMEGTVLVPSARDPEDILESLIQYTVAGMAGPVPVAVRVGAGHR